MLAAVVGGCSSGESTSATAVTFRITAPYCGAISYAFRFTIDSAQVGTDTLRDGESSTRYPTTPGRHVLGAAVTAGSFAHFSFDTTVTLPADTTFVQVVDIYCS
jgi:hypothetical protein